MSKDDVQLYPLFKLPIRASLASRTFCRVPRRASAFRFLASHAPRNELGGPPRRDTILVGELGRFMNLHPIVRESQAQFMLYLAREGQTSPPSRSLAKSIVDHRQLAVERKPGTAYLALDRRDGFA